MSADLTSTLVQCYHLVVIGGDYGRACRHSHDIVTFCTYGEMHFFTVPVIFLCSPHLRICRGGFPPGDQLTGLRKVHHWP
jgi:hypothetical protein